MQEESGVDVVSDGELRRFGFIGSLIEIVEGIGAPPGAPQEWHRDGGGTEGYQRPSRWLEPAPAGAVPGGRGVRLRRAPGRSAP